MSGRMDLDKNIKAKIDRQKPEDWTHCPECKKRFKKKDKRTNPFRLRCSCGFEIQKA